MTGNEWEYSFKTLLPGDIQPHQVVTLIHPREKIPVLVGWKGKAHTSDDQAATVGFEFPIQTHHSIDKPGQELHDVSLFLGDCVEPDRITRRPAADTNDPPDVVAFVDGQQFGIEATQLLLPEVQLGPAMSNVGRWNIFERLRMKIMQESDAQDFTQHQGLLAVAYFGGHVGSSAKRLPPARNADVEYMSRNCGEYAQL